MYHQRSLYQQNGGDAAFEFLAHRPAVPDFHSHPCPDASSKESRQQKRCFRKCAIGFLCPACVNAVRHEYSENTFIVMTNILR